MLQNLHDSNGYTVVKSGFSYLVRLKENQPDEKRSLCTACKKISNICPSGRIVKVGYFSYMEFIPSTFLGKIRSFFGLKNQTNEIIEATMDVA